jgi:hypothetical protein
MQSAFPDGVLVVAGSPLSKSSPRNTPLEADRFGSYGVFGDRA